MNNLGFDSHQFVKDLKKAKMPEAQAEVLVKHYVSHRSQLADNVATKDDLSQLKQLLEAKIDALEQRLLSRFMMFYLSGILAVCTILGFLMAFFTGHFGS